jgi:hypothetical protein
MYRFGIRMKGTKGNVITVRYKTYKELQKWRNYIINQ